MEEKFQKEYSTDDNLLKAQDLWQAHYQILLIILLKEFIKSNVNMDKIKKRCEDFGIKYKDCECFLEYTNFKNDLVEYKCSYCNKNYQKKS